MSISKIQQRYGLNENLPQLSAGEFGWSLDARRLFIGNGPISEGAPIVGNTEVLTEFSDILSITDSYQYRGLAAGYTHQTGVSSASPTTRSLQLKLDDFASVKDFGAVGDGVTDDTDAINRAFFQLFCRESNEETRRSILFPAGVYIVSDTIRVPTYAQIYGEGKNSTIVRGDSVTPFVLIELADRLQQTGPNIGTNGAGVPEYIEIYDMSWENLTEDDVLLVTSTQNSRFSRVNFTGYATTGPSSGTVISPTVVRLASTGINKTSNLVFEHCDIRNCVMGVETSDEMQSILFNSCLFENLWRGAWIGEDIGAGEGPRGIKFTNSVFDKIYNHGLLILSIPSTISAFNCYNDVGTNLTGVPSVAVLQFESDGSLSLCDCFDRTDVSTYPLIGYDAASGRPDTFGVVAGDGIYHGYYKAAPARAVVLPNNTAAPTSTTLTFSAVNDRTVQIYYSASRFLGTQIGEATPATISDVRQGVLRITSGPSTVTIADSFGENNGPIGLTFSATASPTLVTLNFTSTDVAGRNILFKYRIERMI